MTVQFVDLISARHAGNGQMECVIRVSTDGHEEDWPFSYSPTDPHGLAPDVRQYLADHPDFPIQPAI